MRCRRSQRSWSSDATAHAGGFPLFPEIAMTVGRRAPGLVLTVSRYIPVDERRRVRALPVVSCFSMTVDRRQRAANPYGCWLCGLPSPESLGRTAAWDGVRQQVPKWLRSWRRRGSCGTLAARWRPLPPLPLAGRRCGSLSGAPRGCLVDGRTAARGQDCGYQGTCMRRKSSKEQDPRQSAVVRRPCSMSRPHQAPPEVGSPPRHHTQINAWFLYG